MFFLIMQWTYTISTANLRFNASSKRQRNIYELKIFFCHVAIQKTYTTCIQRLKTHIIFIFPLLEAVHLTTTNEPILTHPPTRHAPQTQLTMNTTQIYGCHKAAAIPTSHTAIPRHIFRIQWRRHVASLLSRLRRIVRSFRSSMRHRRIRVHHHIIRGQWLRVQHCRDVDMFALYYWNEELWLYFDIYMWHRSSVIMILFTMCIL